MGAAPAALAGAPQKPGRAGCGMWTRLKRAYMPAATCQAKRTTSTATAMRHCGAGCRHDGGCHQHVALRRSLTQKPFKGKVCVLPQCLVLRGTQPTRPTLTQCTAAFRSARRSRISCSSWRLSCSCIPHGPWGRDRHFLLECRYTSSVVGWPLHCAAAALRSCNMGCRTSSTPPLDRAPAAAPFTPHPGSHQLGGQLGGTAPDSTSSQPLLTCSVGHGTVVCYSGMAVLPLRCGCTYVHMWVTSSLTHAAVQPALQLKCTQWHAGST